MKSKVLRTFLCLGTLVSLSSCGNNSCAHDYKKYSAVPASCEEVGHELYYKCTKCDEIFNANKEVTTMDKLTIAALGHDYGELQPEVQPTDCAHPGHYSYYECQREECGKFFDSSKNEKEWSELLIEAKHTLEHHPRVEPTYKAPGNIEYWECSECGAKFKDAEGKEPTNYVKIDQLTRFSSVRIATQEGDAGAYWGYEEDETSVTVKNGVSAFAGHGEYIYLGLKDGVALGNFELSATFTSNLSETYDNVGVGVKSYISNAFTSYGGIVRPNLNLSRVTFGGFQGGTSEFIKTVAGYASLEDAPEALSKNFIDNGDGTRTYTIKVVRSNEGISWFIGDYLVGTEEYYTDPTGSTKANCYYYADEKLDAAIVIRNHNKDKNEQNIVIEDINIVTEKVEHTLLHNDGYPATACKPGMLEHYRCVICDAYFDANRDLTTKSKLEIPSEHGDHDYYDVAEVPATYDADGCLAHVACHNCDCVFDAEHHEVTPESLVIHQLEGWKEEKLLTPDNCNFKTEHNATGFKATVTTPAQTGGSSVTQRYIVKNEALAQFTLKATVEINNVAGSDFEFGYSDATNDGSWNGLGLLFRESGLIFKNNTGICGSAGVSFAASDLKVGDVYKMEVELIKYNDEMIFNLYKSGSTAVYKTFALKDGIAATGRPTISVRNHSGAQSYTFTNITLSTDTPTRKWAPAKTYIPGNSDFVTEYTETGMKITFPNSADVYNNRYIIKDEAMANFTIKFSFETNIGGASGNDFEVGYAEATADSNWYGIGMLFRSSGLISQNKSGTFGALSGAPTYATNDFKVGDVYKCDIELVKNGTSMTINIYKSGETTVYKTATVNDAAATGKPCICIRNHQKQSGYYNLSNITLA